MADGWLPEGEVNVRFRDTLPLAAAVPEERARASGPDCPKETRADSREEMAMISAIWPCVEDLFIGSSVCVFVPKVIERSESTGTQKSISNSTVQPQGGLVSIS